MTSGSWMQAMIFTVPAQCTHFSISMRNTRLMHLAQVMARRFSGQMIAMMRDRDIVKPGEYIIYTEGDSRGVSGGTNSMKIIQA